MWNTLYDVEIVQCWRSQRTNRRPTEGQSSKAVFLLWIFLLVMLNVGVCCAVVSVRCSLVVTCWEGTGLLAVVSYLLCHCPKMSPGPHQNYGRGWRRGTGLSPPVKYFTDRSKAVLLLWIFYGVVLPCICYAFVHVCLYVPFGHLLGKG